MSKRGKTMPRKPKMKIDTQTVPARPSALLIGFPYRARLRLIKSVARQMEPLDCEDARKLCSNMKLSSASA